MFLLTFCTRWPERERARARVCVCERERASEREREREREREITRSVVHRGKIREDGYLFLGEDWWRRSRRTQKKRAIRRDMEG
jgi:hypothetical protein